MSVDLGCGDRFVPEPERDDGGIDSGCQQSHGRGVPQDVRRDLLAFEGRLAESGRGGVLGEPPFYCVAAHR